MSDQTEPSAELPPRTPAAVVPPLTPNGMQTPVPYAATLGAHLGIVMDPVPEGTVGQVTGSVAVHDGVRQPMGLVHGGTYAAIAEEVASVGTNLVTSTLAAEAGGGIGVGLSNNTAFLRPITDGTIRFRAETLHRGRTTWVWDVTFTDDAGRPAATSRVTIAVRPPRAG